MNIDSVITLENNVNCLLLEKVQVDNINYYLAVVLDEEEEPTEESVIFKEIIENNQLFVEKVEDIETISKAIELFSNNVKTFVNNIK